MTREQLAIPAECEELYVLEYSPTQKTFHYNTLKKSININAMNARQGRILDWIPLYIARNIDDLSEPARLFGEKLKTKSLL